MLVFAPGCVGCAQAQHSGQDRSSEPSLVGEWVIAEQSVAPLGIASLCQSIQPGTIVTFSPATLAVRVEAAGKPCAVLAYKVQGQRISFLREDMVWLGTYELTARRLTIRSPNFFTAGATGQGAGAPAPTGPGPEIRVTLIRK